MDSENRLRKKIIENLKEKYDLVPMKGFMPDLSFPILNKGDSFRHLFTWELKDFKTKTFLCSIRNSYEIEGLNNYYYFSKTDVTDRYFILLLETDSNLPDLIIRPAYFVDRLSNLFLRFDKKIKERKQFNSKYILETSSDRGIDTVLSRHLTDKIKGYKNFYLEISNGRILIKFEIEQSIETVNRLLEIGKMIDSILINNAA